MLLFREEVLTEKNFLLYAAKHYENPACTGIDEFNSDIRRIKYIKKLCTRYEQTGELKERLILNHLIVLSNVFRPPALCRILFLKMESQFHFVKPFLITIGFLVPKIENVKEERVVDTAGISMDSGIIFALRRLLLPNRLQK